MNETELEEAARKKAKEETKDTDNQLAETYYFIGFQDGYKCALNELENKFMQLK